MGFPTAAATTTVLFFPLVSADAAGATSATGATGATDGITTAVEQVYYAAGSLISVHAIAE